jgi:DNA-binding transcriptional regulator YhcF (GntR family)
MFRYLLNKPKVHEAVSSLIRFAIDNGLQAGAKLPPIRDLASILDVSTYTVYCAIRELKKADVIEHAGKKVMYLKKLPAEIEKKEVSAAVSKKEVSLYFSDSYDIRKINSIILRHNFNSLFMKRHPDVFIKEVQLNDSRLDFESNIIRNLLLGENEPTGLEITQAALPFYKRCGLLAPINNKKVFEHCSNLRPECVEKAKIDDVLYMMPISRSISFIVYNKKFLADNGLSFEMFKTWNSFEAGLERLKSAMDEIPFSISNGTETVFMLMHWVLQQLNCKLFETPSRIDWFGVEAERALEYFYRLVFGKKLLELKEVSTEDKIISLLMEEIPFVFATTGDIAGAILNSKAADKFGIAFIPAVEESKRITLGNIRGNVINSHSDVSETEAYLDYAMEREEWIYMKEGAQEYLKSRRIPQPYSLYKNPAIDKFTSSIQPMPEEWKESFNKLEKHVVWEPAASGWEKLLLGEIIETAVAKEELKDFETMKDFFYKSCEIKYSDSIMNLVSNNINK